MRICALDYSKCEHAQDSIVGAVTELVGHVQQQRRASLLPFFSVYQSSQLAELPESQDLANSVVTDRQADKTPITLPLAHAHRVIMSFHTSRLVQHTLMGTEPPPCVQ